MSRIDPITGFKTCSKCKVVYEKPFESFYRRTLAPDGLESRCKGCASEVGREWRARPEEKAWAKEYHRTHWGEEDNRRNRERYATDSDYRRKTIDDVVSRERNLVKDGTVTKESLRQLYEIWTGICPFCGQESEPTIDHIIPVTKGGGHSIENLQLMCKNCNSRKGNKSQEDFLESLDFSLKTVYY